MNKNEKEIIYCCDMKGVFKGIVESSNYIAGTIIIRNYEHIDILAWE